jgi:hypothetical protein
MPCFIAQRSRMSFPTANRFINLIGIEFDAGLLVEWRDYSRPPMFVFECPM